MTTYNGHKNWNHWNVCLWLMNDEGLHSLTMAALRRCRTKNQAAQQILENLTADVGAHVYGARGPITATPDGAPYTYTSIRAALVGL